MARRAATFTETDVRRAIKAVRDAGVVIGSVEITKDGTIRIVQPATAEPETVDERKAWHF